MKYNASWESFGELSSSGEIWIQELMDTKMENKNTIVLESALSTLNSTSLKNKQTKKPTYSYKQLF